MESVNKVISTASHAIWGDNDAQSQQAQSQQAQQSHEEPISGVQGKGFASDPFDAGNRDGKFTFNTSCSSPATYACLQHEPPHLVTGVRKWYILVPLCI